MQRLLEIIEQRILYKLLDQCTFDTSSLRPQVAIIKVQNVNDDGSILRFENLKSAPPAPIPPIHFVPVEAIVSDTDGVKIHILLHLREGRLYEMEYLKEDGTIIMKHPDPQEMKEFILTS